VVPGKFLLDNVGQVGYQTGVGAGPLPHVQA
jgi:hypothetical protein